jgi:hypothetical protein
MRSLNDGNLEAQKKFGVSRNKITKELNIDFAKAQVELQNLAAKNGEAVVGLWAEQVGITADQAKLIENRGAELEAAKKDAQRTLEAFGFNDQMVADQSKFSQKVIRFWYDVDTAWSTLLGTAEKPITTQLEKLDKWIEEHPDEVKALMILGGGVTAAGGTKVVGGLLGRALGFGGSSKALTGSAAALSGSAKALDEAALKLGAAARGGIAGGGPGRSPTGLGVRGVLAAATGVGVLLNAPDTDKEMADQANGFNSWFNGTFFGKWLNKQAGGESPKWDSAEPLHDRSAPPSTPNPEDTRSWWQKEKDLWWMGGKKDSDKPTKDATPDALETGNAGGFRIPGSDKSIDIADQAVSLKSGGTIVQSGNPLPVRIEKIDPAAGGIGGGGGGGQGGADNAPGAHGHWGGAARGRGFHNDAPELSSDTGQPILVPLHRGFDGFKVNGGLGGPRARPESQCCERRPGSAL